VECFKVLGVVGRERARAFFDERGWKLDNNDFAELKAEAAEMMELFK
jgi:hypothetical protein